MNNLLCLAKCVLLSVPVFADELSKKAPSTSYDEFRRHLQHAEHLVAITGAGISAESGIPTFRGTDGLWRNIKVDKVATPSSFKNNPGTVWEFYHYRREMVKDKKPNKAHFALVEVEKWLNERGKNFTLITMNVDGLHKLAGSKHVVELHGSLFETKCTKCKNIELNRDSPICPVLAGTEKNVIKYAQSNISVEQLPRCKHCTGLLRPNVVWYDEDLDDKVNTAAWDNIDKCDLAMLIGSSSMVFPGALFAPQISHRHVPVAEFNIKHECYTDSFGYFFEGKCTDTVPQALDTKWVDPTPELFNPEKFKYINDWRSSLSFNENSSSEIGSDKTIELIHSSGSSGSIVSLSSAGFSDNSKTATSEADGRGSLDESSSSSSSSLSLSLSSSSSSSSSSSLSS